MSFDKKFRLVYIEAGTDWLGDYKSYTGKLFLNLDQPYDTHAEALTALAAIRPTGLIFTIVEEYYYRRPPAH